MYIFCGFLHTRAFLSQCRAILCPMTTFDAAVARLAGHQLGLLSRKQAVAAGASERMVQHRMATGRWVRVGPGVYRLAGAPVTWHQRALATCLGAGPEAVVSHRSAAVVWGLSGFRSGPLEITVPHGRSARRGSAIVHRSLYLTRTDRTTHNRIPVTRPARTAVDLAGRVSAELLEEAVDDVLCRRLATLDGIRQRVDALAGRRGSHALATILAAWGGEGMPANVAEMRIVRLLLDAGLPAPVRQHEIRAGGELVARVDLAYPDRRLAVELDSFRWHAGRAPFRSDRVRATRLAGLGWRLLWATPEDAHDGRQVVEAARRLLAVAA
jgi:hypothetical protein